MNVVDARRSRRRTWIEPLHLSMFAGGVLAAFAAGQVIGEDQLEAALLTWLGIAVLLIAYIVSGMIIELLNLRDIGHREGWHFKINNDAGVAVDIFRYYTVLPKSDRKLLINGQRSHAKNLHWGLKRRLEFGFGEADAHTAVVTFGRRVWVDVDGERLAEF